MCVCYLVEDEAKLIGVQRPFWRVRFAIDQPRSQTRHGAVIDDGAELEEENRRRFLFLTVIIREKYNVKNETNRRKMTLKMLH